MSVPIQLMNPSEVPDELRDISAVPPPKQRSSSFDSVTRPTSKSKQQTDNGNSFVYGRWYIHPKHWRKMKEGEKLVDPKELEIEEDMTEIKMKRAAMAEELATLYITEAFGKFLNEKKTRVPEFLSHAGEIRAKKEEQERLKAEEGRRAKEEYQQSIGMN